MNRTLLVFALVAGCGGAGLGGLSVGESALVDDSNSTDSLDDDIETGIEEPLSGSPSTDPGAVDPAVVEADLGVKIRVNPGNWFRPAGCIVSTVDGMTATSVFTNCTGPLGLHTYNGTVTSKWTIGSGALTVTHDATDFQIDGATVEHHATIEYTKSGALYTRHRTGTTTGSTKSGAAIDHSFDYTASWDSTNKCITRDGSSNLSVGARAYGRSIAGYKRCGVGAWGCPLSGTITITREQPSPALSLTLAFPGGAAVDVTRPNGTTVERPLLCDATP